MRIGYSLSQSGLKAQQTKMNQLANDIANVDTVGYKQKSTSFRELLINDVTEQDVLLSENAGEIGQYRGVQSGITGTNFAQGALVETGQPYHFAIDGEGFFLVTSPEGNQYLTRDGAFSLDEAGNMVNDRGHYLTIEGDVNGDFTIPVYSADNLQELQPIGENYFALGDGFAQLGGLGAVRQGYLEQSNVDLAQSMTEMIVAQRAYSLNAQAVRSTDDIYQIINQFNT